MALNAFTSRLGRGQGRIRPSHALAQAGEFVFVLGDDDPGRFFELAPGDHAAVTQQVDLTGVTLVRASLRLRAPKTLPSGLAWEVSLVVDGESFARARSGRGRERVITDLAANVSKSAGVHAVGIRLELVPE